MRKTRVFRPAALAVAALTVLIALLTGGLCALAEETATLAGYLWQVQYADATGSDARVARCLVISSSPAACRIPPAFPLQPSYQDVLLYRLTDAAVSWKAVVDGSVVSDVGAVQDGYFAIPGLAPGSHTLCFEVGSCRSATVTLSLAPGVNLLDLHLLVADPFSGYPFTTASY